MDSPGTFGTLYIRLGRFSVTCSGTETRPPDLLRAAAPTQTEDFEIPDRL
jgi:hypothetical protein